MKSKVNNLKCYKNMEVSIPYFLYNYCGLSDDRAYSMTHGDLKKLMPQLKRISFLVAYNNPKQIYSGQIILIKDAKKHIIPYVSPFNSIESAEEIYNEEGMCKKPKKERKLIGPCDLETMRNYELKMNLKLQRSERLYGSYKMCRLIKKEIHRRGIQGSGRKRTLIDIERGKQE